MFQRAKEPSGVLPPQIQQAKTTDSVEEGRIAVWDTEEQDKAKDKSKDKAKEPEGVLEEGEREW